MRVDRKFPEEDSWRSYLGRFSGSSNAYTSSNNVNFYFSVGSTGLQGGLERFAQFFVAPLFDKASMARELQAVHAEHMKNRLSDNWREQQLFQSLSNGELPWHKFTTGNLVTLGSTTMDELRQTVADFFHAHFIGPKLRVVVVAPQALDVLER